MVADATSLSPSDVDDPYNAEASSNIRALVLDGTGAAYVAIRHLYDGSAPTTPPIVTAYGYFPNSQPDRDTGVVRNVAGEWCELQRRDTGVFAHTLSTAALDDNESTPAVKASSHVLVDAMGASKVLVLLQTAAAGVGHASTLSVIQARAISYS